MSNFVVGDVVCLKSGGPNMTITGGNPHTKKFKCEWFDSNGERQTGNYPPSVLEYADDDDDDTE